MAHGTSDLLSFSLKQQQAYLACKAHLVREHCHQAHSRVPCCPLRDQCARVYSGHLLLQLEVVARPPAFTAVVQGDTNQVEGRSAALPFPYSCFPVGMEMLCLLSAPILQKGHLLKVGSPTVRAVATSYSLGFLRSQGDHLLTGVSGACYQRISVCELLQYQWGLR